MKASKRRAQREMKKNLTTAGIITGGAAVLAGGALAAVKAFSSKSSKTEDKMTDVKEK